ncbi:protein PTCD3 homolog, mitochondrial [Cimex lectularius]|uniref:Small ribosomal subunit protein mS39 n=1 Tax=Cimex lectularius TaxID=79782 RepID=A0A8I6TG37_CIMLE|nr:protein PTCD3 homolog, mitochondrial [Cimex lectularius]
MSVNLRALSSILRPKANRLVIGNKYSSDAVFVPPKRIQRSPTDILKAISSTVGKDPTAPHYKYHDDPYLIPYSHSTKRSYSMSQEAGRKAAQWIREQHADLFQHKEADPMIEKFSPKPVYNEESNVNEDILKNVINAANVSDAVIIYELLVKKEQEISLPTKLSLLELLCFYNGEDPLSEDWIEERWYRQGTKKREFVKNCWRGNEPIQQLFRELSESELKSDAYCTLICGMLNYGQVDGGWDLYEKSKAAGVALNTETFNCLISKAFVLKEGHRMVLEVLEGLAKDMNSRGLRANLGTLNKLLKTLSAISSNKQAREMIFMTFSEFKRLQIEPSAASYFYLMQAFYKNKNELEGLMVDILDNLEGKRLGMRDEDDTNFFLKAMEIASFVLRDKELAYKIDSLLHYEDNYNLLGASFRESVYYRYFFTIICGSESFEDFLELYDRLVPNVYIPEPKVMSDILMAVETQMAWEHLRRLWSDMVLFEHSDRIELVEKVLAIAVDCSIDTLYEDMAQIGWSVWQKIEAQFEAKKIRTNNIERTGGMLGQLLTLFVRAGELSKAHLIMDKLLRDENKIIGEPDIKSIAMYLDSCIANKSPDTAIKCIKYCNTMGFIEATAFAVKLNKELDLNENQKARLSAIVGNECLDSES